MRSKIGMAMSMVSPSRSSKVAAILRRWYTQHAAKCAVHGLYAAEAAGFGDLGHAAGGGLQQAARRLHALRFDVGGGRHADLAAERAREVARAHVGPARQRRHGELAVGVIGDPALHVAEAVALGELGRELRADLRLAARPAQ